MQSFRWRRPGRPPLSRGALGEPPRRLGSRRELPAHPRVPAPQRPLTPPSRNPARQAGRLHPPPHPPGLAAGPAEPRAPAPAPRAPRALATLPTPSRQLRGPVATEDGEGHGAGLTRDALTAWPCPVPWHRAQPPLPSSQPRLHPWAGAGQAAPTLRCRYRGPRGRPRCSHFPTSLL